MNGIAILGAFLAICHTATADTLHFGDTVYVQGFADVRRYASMSSDPINNDWVGKNEDWVGMRTAKTVHEQWIIEEYTNSGSSASNGQPVTHGSTVVFKQGSRYLQCDCNWCKLSKSRDGFYLWTVTGKGGDEVQSGQQVKLVNKTCNKLLQQAWYQWEYGRGYWVRNDGDMSKSNAQVQWVIYKPQWF